MMVTTRSTIVISLLFSFTLGSHVYGFPLLIRSTAVTTRPCCWVPPIPGCIKNLHPPHVYPTTKAIRRPLRGSCWSIGATNSHMEQREEEEFKVQSQKQQQGLDSIRCMVESAILKSGASTSDIRSIDFLPGRLVVTMEGSSAFLSAPEGEDDEDLLIDEDEDLLIDDDDEVDDDDSGVWMEMGEDEDGMIESREDSLSIDEDEESGLESGDTEDMIQELDMEDEDDEPQMMNLGEEKPFKVDIGTIAKVINEALEAGGEGSLGYEFACKNEIEVTTPGASDILTGVMFESYRGFDVQVILKSMESDAIIISSKKKNKSSNIIEGKLIEKTNQCVLINQKGRIKRIKNELIECVRLPKAKKER
jgi:hypothetical protein